MSNLASMLKGFADKAFTLSSSREEVIQQLKAIGQVTPEVRDEFCVGHVASYIVKNGSDKLTKVAAMKYARAIVKMEVKKRNDFETKAYGAARQQFSSIRIAAGLGKVQSADEKAKAAKKREDKRKAAIEAAALELVKKAKATRRVETDENPVAIWLASSETFVKANAKKLTGDLASRIREFNREIAKALKESKKAE